jgi:hypothetical protein
MKAGGVGSGLGALDGCGGCMDLGGADFLAPILLGFVLFFFVFLVVAWIVDVVRRRRSRPKPSGASRLSGKSPRHPMPAVVRAAKRTLDAPLSDRTCVAWGVELLSPRSEGAGPVFLIDGETAELELELDDGRIVRVPAGRSRIFGPTGRHPRGAAGYYLSTRPLDEDPDPDAEHFPLVPADHATEMLVNVGDRVHLRAELTPADGVYREVTRYVTTGPVELTIPLE